MKARHLLNREVPESQLIITDEHAVYHLNVRGDHIADTVIVVGDPDRVGVITSRFEDLEMVIRGREFHVHTGRYKGKRITVMSTGIGVDNIDIVVNELDAAVNIDPLTRKPKAELRSLRIVRVGTCGALREDIPIGTMIASKYAIGYDGVPWHYDLEMEPDEQDLALAFAAKTDWPAELARPYCAKADEELLQTVGEGMLHGVTITANGFYGPQNRAVRLPLRDEGMMERVRHFEHNGERAANFEMECAGLYALSGMLGHQVLTTCVVLANRYNEAFTTDPSKAVNALIDQVLERL
jgi:uridine phosphorylase